MPRSSREVSRTLPDQRRADVACRFVAQSPRSRSAARQRAELLRYRQPVQFAQRPYRMLDVVQFGGRLPDGVTVVVLCPSPVFQDQLGDGQAIVGRGAGRKRVAVGVPLCDEAVYASRLCPVAL